jgi:hypothetical protein
MKLIFCQIILTLSVVACTSTSGVIPDGRDSYRIVHTGDTGFTNSNTLQKNAYGEASKFCRDKGKVVETKHLESKQARPMGGWPEATLIFRCITRNE